MRVHRGGVSRTTEARRARAEAFFQLYWQLGPTRSLEALHGILAAGGLRISLNTLKAYSADFGWQKGILHLEEEERHTERDVVSRIGTMNARQAALGRAAQELAHRYFETALEAEHPLSAGDAIRLAKDGAALERIAMGEATTRAEVIVSVYGELLVSIEELFVEVMGPLETQTDVERNRRFRLGVDQLVEAHATGSVRAERHAVEAEVVRGSPS